MSAPTTSHEVLVVDDDYAFRWALARFCQRAGIEADVAENGREALELLSTKKSKYCSIVLDLDRPGVSSLDVLSKLLEDNSTANVLVVSAFPDLVRDLLAHKNAGQIKKTFLKPVDVAEIVDHLGAICERHHTKS